MESYIVRIYRRDQKQSTKVQGVVEQVGKQQRMTFHSLSELVRIFNLTKKRTSRLDVGTGQDSRVRRAPTTARER